MITLDEALERFDNMQRNQRGCVRNILANYLEREIPHCCQPALETVEKCNKAAMNCMEAMKHWRLRAANAEARLAAAPKAELREAILNVTRLKAELAEANHLLEAGVALPDEEACAEIMQLRAELKEVRNYLTERTADVKRLEEAAKEKP